MKGARENDTSLAIRSRVSLQRALGVIFIFFSTIPWVGLPFLDSQPWPLLLCFTYIFLNLLPNGKKIKIPQSLIYILGLLLAGIVYSIIFELFTGEFQNNFLIYRGIANYIGIISYIIAFFFFIKNNGCPYRILFFSNILWLVIGFIQIFLPSITSLIVAQRTTIGRGVTSLSPEPTFFGIYLFFSSWILLVIKDYEVNQKLKILLIVNLLSIVFLAKSSMVVFYLIISSMVFILSQLSLKRVKKIASYLIGVTLLLIVVYQYLITFLPNSRISILLQIASDLDFWELAKQDASINERLASLVLPWVGFVKNYLLPGGFNSFGEINQQLAFYYGDFFSSSRFINSKIMSWLGSLIYELGIFGLVSYFMLLFFAKSKKTKRFFELLLLTLLLLSAIPLAFPLISLLITLFYFRKA